MVRVYLTRISCACVYASASENHADLNDYRVGFQYALVLLDTHLSFSANDWGQASRLFADGR